MSWTKTYMRLVERFLPSPFAIAVILTVFTSLMALILTEPTGPDPHLVQLFFNWEMGVWGLLKFTMQMMLMLVLGHSLALSKPVFKLIGKITSYCTNNSNSAVIVTLFSIITGYFNWGLGLIFGAILARKVAEHAQEKGFPLNFPLIGACAYTSIMVWHGGLSGSAPLTIAKGGHSLESVMGVIPISETIFSQMNFIVFGAIIIALPILAYYLSKSSDFQTISTSKKSSAKLGLVKATGAEKLDQWTWFGRTFGALIIVVGILRFWAVSDKFTFLNLDTVNLLLFGLSLSLHGSIAYFINAVEEAMRDSTGILIQFPLYAGIMGIMNHSGLLEVFANFFIQLSSPTSFPFFAFLSSGIVNVLVPSGGGQWQVQGPILIEAASQLDYPFSKTVMALAYGDQLTNMLQPFWALPLLGITGLKARQILPYTLIFMILGGCIYLGALLFL